MTVYNGSTFQTCALRVWGVWVSMRDFHAATVRYNRDVPLSLASLAPQLDDRAPTAIDTVPRGGGANGKRD
jgi:hypothetical protein